MVVFLTYLPSQQYVDTLLKVGRDLPMTDRRGMKEAAQNLRTLGYTMCTANRHSQVTAEHVSDSNMTNL